MQSSYVRNRGVLRINCFIAIAKSFVRFEVALYRHSGIRRNPVFSIPRHAGLDPGFRRGHASREGHSFGNCCRTKNSFGNSFRGRIIALAPFGGMRNDFQKEDCQGENPFAKGAPRTASNAFVQVLG